MIHITANNKTLHKMCCLTGWPKLYQEHIIGIMENSVICCTSMNISFLMII